VCGDVGHPRCFFFFCFIFNGSAVVVLLQLLLHGELEFDLGRPIRDLLGLRGVSLCFFFFFFFVFLHLFLILSKEEHHDVWTFSRKETLGAVIDRLTTKRAYRLICVDTHNRVEGVLSLSDILLFLASNP
jgi:hypothetical protein